MIRLTTAYEICFTGFFFPLCVINFFPSYYNALLDPTIPRLQCRAQAPNRKL